jgi:hypothetical protein
MKQVLEEVEVRGHYLASAAEQDQERAMRSCCRLALHGSMTGNSTLATPQAFGVALFALP